MAWADFRRGGRLSHEPKESVRRKLVCSYQTCFRPGLLFCLISQLIILVVMDIYSDWVIIHVELCRQQYLTKYRPKQLWYTPTRHVLSFLYSYHYQQFNQIVSFVLKGRSAIRELPSEAFHYPDNRQKFVSQRTTTKVKTWRNQKLFLQRRWLKFMWNKILQQSVEVNAKLHVSMK